MKKILYNISALMMLVIGFTACAPTEVDDVFDESAAVRLDKAVANYKTYFADKGGKWVMEYFCNESEPGYAFVVSFNKNGSVTVAGNNRYIGGYNSDTSLWDVIADNGPVLTFNTYNNVLHTFSNPEDIPQTSDVSELGRGHEGDYEFMIMKTDDDRCELRGKKSGFTIIMERIDSATEDKEYMDGVVAKANSSFTSLVDSLYMETGNGVKFVVFNASSLIWSFYPYGKDAISTTESMNCVATAEGIRFLYPLDFIQDYDTQQEIAIQNFAYQPDGTLLCTDDNATRIYGDPLIDIFLNGKITWQVDKADIYGNFLAYYEKIEEEIPVVFKNSTFGGFSLTFNKKTEKLTMRFLTGRNAKNVGNIHFDVTRGEGNNLRLSFNVDETGSCDNNGKQHYNRVDSFKGLIDYMTSTEFTLNAENLMCPNPMKFTSKANESDYMMLSF